MNGVAYDDLLNALSDLTSLRPGPDGLYTWHPVSLSATITSSKHSEDTAHVVVQATADESHSFQWRTTDHLVIELDGAQFHVVRDQVGEVLYVDLPEQPHTRTVSIEYIAELRLDITAEYEHREPVR